MKSGRPATNMTGRVYGTLTVGERGPNAERGGHTQWWCTCSECGVTKLVAGCNLRQGNVKSCACQRYGPKARENMRLAAIERWRRAGKPAPGTHGRSGMYNNGCRCEACSEAHRVWRNARVEKELVAAEAGEPMRFEHGTYTAYTLGLCRCEECREAANEIDRDFVARRRRDREAGIPLPDGVEHGTRYAYNKWCCRCDDCKEATRKYQADYEARKREGIVNPRDAENRIERIRTVES